MNPIQRQQTHIQSLQAFKKHNSDGNGRITAAEIKTRMDTDQNSQLSQAEFERAGISDVDLQQDIQKNIGRDKPNPNAPSFTQQTWKNAVKGCKKTGASRAMDRAGSRKKAGHRLYPNTTFAKDKAVAIP